MSLRSCPQPSCSQLSISSRWPDGPLLQIPMASRVCGYAMKTDCCSQTHVSPPHPRCAAGYNACCSECAHEARDGGCAQAIARVHPLVRQALRRLWLRSGSAAGEESTFTRHAGDTSRLESCRMSGLCLYMWPTSFGWCKSSHAWQGVRLLGGSIFSQ